MVTATQSYFYPVTELQQFFADRSIFAFKELFYPRSFLFDLLPTGGVCAEIGVHRGFFAQKILQHNRPLRLHLIDPWQYDAGAGDMLWGGRWGRSQRHMDKRFAEVKQRFAPHLEQQQVKIHRNYSQNAAHLFPDDYFDWVYIDADHRYTAVHRDLDLFATKVKPGGYLVGDDYNGIYTGYWRDGVRRAVAEMAARPDMSLEMVKNGQFILRRL